jgi:hypothetical protein
LTPIIIGLPVDLTGLSEAMMTDKQLIKRIIELALKIKETESLSKATDELKTMELEKMFTTKEGKYYTL